MSKKAYIGALADSIKNIDIIENNINNYFYCETPWGDGEAAFGVGGGFYWNDDQLCNEEQLAYDIPPKMSWRALTDIIELSFQCNDAAALRVYYNDTFISNTYNSTVALTLLKNDIIEFIYDDSTNTYSPQDEVYISNIKITIKNEIEESVAHNVSNIYIGIPTEIPTQKNIVVDITPNNFNNYFLDTDEFPTNGTFPNRFYFFWKNGKLVNNDISNATTGGPLTAMLFFTPKIDINNFSFKCNGKYNGVFYPSFEVCDLDYNYIRDVEFNEETGELNCQLNQGEILSGFYEDYGLSEGEVYFSDIKIELLNTDTIIQNMARKVIKAYVGVNGVAKQWYGDVTCKIPFTNNFIDYTGNNITPVWNNYDSSKMDMSGDVSATEIGVYTTIFTLKQGCVWVDGTTDPKYVTWEIVLSLQDLLIDFNYTEDNGIATITGWKGTYQGVTSTEIIVPDDNRIIL